MRVWLLQLWDRLKSSFWFLPLGMMLAATVLGLFTIWVDDQIAIPERGPFAWLIVNAPTARATLSLLSGAMITLSSVVVSMTMVTLSLTSSQFGSRLLRTAMTDFTTQVSLGAFLSTTLYCLVVLRFIPVDADSPFVPHLAVFLGSVLTFISLVMMILFVHHIGVAIQAQNVVAEVAADLDSAIQRLFPERLGKPRSTETEGDEDDQPGLGSRGDDKQKSAITLPATYEGYLQNVDAEGLLDFARENELVIELLYRPGDFLIRGTPLAQLLDAEKQIDDEEKRQKLTAALNATIITGRSRTPRQDVCCAVTELVEVAVRALSPGINDPFTAVACIDRMTASLSRLIVRDLPSPYRYDAEGILRVIAQPVSIPHIIEIAFSQIGYYGAGDLLVAVRMMEGFEQLMTVAQRDQDRAAIREQATRLVRRANQTQNEPLNEERLKNLRDRVRDSSETEA